ncbi:nuclear transport factor 2 family protein [Sphingomonas sp. MMS12-HWE2-04]|uniref:nuclear transport factor 2 family protein n=1 Tax=Sphingomonas sp. MMS12-HWE2-04 TaxID=3234199 RepID=UPI00384ADAC0
MATVDAAVVAPVQQQPAEQGVLVRLVEDFVRAQAAFDAARLGALTTADYLEISPIGEVDSRDKMLGFYAPDKKTDAPAVEILEPVVRVFGDSAIVFAKLAYTIQVPGQPPRMMALRASYVAHRMAGSWKLASSHYTGIRPATR